MSAYEHFPTEFAIQVARKAKIYPDGSASKYKGKEKDQMIRFSLLLGEFQQISVLSGFDKAIGIYANEELSDKQEDALRLIAEFAPVQASGIAVESMMSIIKTNTQHKDYTRILELLMENLNRKEDEFADGKEMEKLINELLDE